MLIRNMNFENIYLILIWSKYLVLLNANNLYILHSNMIFFNTKIRINVENKENHINGDNFDIMT